MISKKAIEAAFWKHLLILGVTYTIYHGYSSKPARLSLNVPETEIFHCKLLFLLEPNLVLDGKSWFSWDNHAIIKPNKK